MPCRVFPERGTCPGAQSVSLAKQAWNGMTGAMGAVAVCQHTPVVSSWMPDGPSGGYSVTLTCNISHTKSLTVHTPEDHRACS